MSFTTETKSSRKLRLYTVYVINKKIISIGIELFVSICDISYDYLTFNDPSLLIQIIINDKKKQFKFINHDQNLTVRELNPFL